MVPSAKNAQLAPQRALIAAEPALRLSAERTEAKTGEVLAITVEFAGIEGVELSLQPAGILDLDLTSLSKPGLVRLRALADGKASLIATAHGAAIERIVHLDCEGPCVRIGSFGYMPPKD